ncbi:bifunctional phosphopantothenoylcysteine decarboxylase/phosphopantothenate--cysteine ligase CoaBC [Cellulosilyticum ruminicola]|uniref:bifunctional phosphopantothenoylcysteine decarboxylase/phosphopantothenate--cysteine ligase CoaBC n=1 Tax=Cellulosilyticum ruminicola TaxID=425254 RepID=UPI0006D1A138|nr:bifunctional phosphopantothenoylcysteine decarboxylase/phosphopantothenate--cysteine ligase CoaBC [Cellulosilyticum ruminicola]
MKKHVLIGVTGGIAVYKILDVESKLRKLGYEMNTIMTKNACEFVQPMAFQTISNNYVVTDTFERPHKWEVEHISLAKKADIMLIAPATANVIGKIAHGIADDMLTTTVMAAKCPVVIAPAMNTAMYENEIVQENIAYLKSKGYLFIEPVSGMLACGDVGSGKLASPDEIVAFVEKTIEESLVKEEISQDLKGRHILVTAGPTVEAIDPFRYITNHSSGKQGYAIAESAVKRGAEVVLVSGPVQIPAPEGVKVVTVKSARDMYEVVHEYFNWSDAVIKAAAVADYRPRVESQHKVKKTGLDDMTLELVRNPDILQSLGEIKSHQVLVGFAAETDNVVEYAMQKIAKKHLDFIVANNIAQQGAGFKGDTNIATIIEANGQITETGQMSKHALGDAILDKVKCYFK